ncbi:MAG: glycosyltransferase [Balneolia bacterium]|nr:glycosyltransferase [Balneolia bacterium]
MKVLKLVHSDYLHDNRVKRQAETLSANGYEVSCACIGDAIPSAAGNVKLISYNPSRKGGKLRFYEVIRFFGRVIKDTPYDIIHAHDLDAFFAASIYRKSRNDCIIYDSHEMYTQSTGVGNRLLPKLIWTAVERLSIGKASAVITVNESIAGLLKSKYSLSEKPFVIRNFTSLTKNESYNSQFSDAATELKESSHTLLLYHGIIQHGRGLDLLFNTLSNDSGVSAIICGDGPRMTHYKYLCEEMDLSSQVLFTGYINSSEFLKLAKIADAGYCIIEPISQSYFYSLPNKLTEYIQAGLPVLASDLPEISRIVNEYKIGVTLSPETFTAQNVSEKLSELRRNSNEYEAGLKQASSKLNWETEKQRLIDIYKKFSA